LLLFAILGIAFLYSSVGHGGATGYLAIMTLLGIAPTFARPGALWMNCFVASVAFWRFQRAGFFNLGLFLQLAIASIPMAWCGSRFHLHGHAYSLILGGALAAAGWLLGWSHSPSANPPSRPVALPLALVTGASLGLLAGLTGIGGGVFLTPLLIFLRWTPPKTAGGISALFIVVNSAAGLLGLGSHALIWQPEFILGPIVGTLGAFVGTYYGVQRWPALTFRRILAVVLWIAAAKLIFTGS
jgi:uncharacterized protein